MFLSVKRGILELIGVAVRLTSQAECCLVPVGTDKSPNGVGIRTISARHPKRINQPQVSLECCFARCISHPHPCAHVPCWTEHPGTILAASLLIHREVLHSTKVRRSVSILRYLLFSENLRRIDERLMYEYSSNYRLVLE
ncbi:hypothetical protein B0T10DRAFT_287333 [Thelonectria olida]|uniref:Uncharacterized protein n=1 Tax=Thelonectria olida TaxID=1576542 RepID=A0A9P8W7N4_9HYPO|nr:hypothetical protein B0T10DRAFT_287333 [Thelonectria olida]